MKINLTGDGKKKNAGLLRLVKTHFLAQKPRFLKAAVFSAIFNKVKSQICRFANH